MARAAVLLDRDLECLNATLKRESVPGLSTRMRSGEKLVMGDLAGCAEFLVRNVSTAVPRSGTMLHGSTGYPLVVEASTL
jgi:hypothetical protein